MEYEQKTAEQFKVIVNEASDKILKVIDEAMNKIYPIEELRKLEAGDKRDNIHSARWLAAQRAINRCWMECYPQAGYIFAEERERLRGHV